MFYYSAVLLWPQQVQALYTTDITYGGWLSVSRPRANVYRTQLTVISLLWQVQQHLVKFAQEAS